MITKLNLASRPFRNRRLPYVLAFLMLAAGLTGLILGFFKYRQNLDSNEIALADISRMEAEIKRLNGEGDKVQQQLTPEQKNLLVAAHKLVANKSFGWSRLFADLEAILPGSVSASRINVENIYQDGDRIKAVLELGVISRDYAAVMSMIDKMNNSGIFQAELRGQDLQKSNNTTFTEYTLQVAYTPNSAYSSVPGTDVAQNPSGGGQP